MLDRTDLMRYHMIQGRFALRAEERILQYQGFAEASKLGSVGDNYIDYGELMKQQFILACFILFRAKYDITPL